MEAAGAASGPEEQHSHSPASRRLNHTHQVFTEANLDAWRANFLAGADDVENYLAIVNSVSAGQDIYYFVVGFALDADVVPVGQTLPPAEVEGPDIVGTLTKLTHVATVSRGVDFTYEGPGIRLSPGYAQSVKDGIQLMDGGSFDLRVQDDDTGERLVFDVAVLTGTLLEVPSSDFNPLVPNAANEGHTYTFTASRFVRPGQ